MVRPSKNILLAAFAAIFTTVTGMAQTDSTNVASTETDNSVGSTDTEPEKPLDFIFRPTLGLGVGMFTFYGDVANNSEGAHPTVSRIGYDLRLSNPLNDYFDLNFHVIYGQTSANERSLTNPERNLNFQSEIRTGGMYVSYNFQNFRKNKERTLEPYIALGFESFEFLSKTDLYDAYGNKYFYWSDGSIRNLDENDPNSASSIMLQRDYVYESDLREQNIDGFGKYRERSWAVPLLVGAQLHLNKRWQFRIGTSMHFTFTDLVDNVSEESIGDRSGNKANDKFLFTSFSLNYDLQRLEDEELPLDETDLDALFDILAQDTVDTDEDGVVDFIDFCQYTEKGVAIDERGCPLDKDADRVFDYKDDEVPTPAGAFVNEKGVAVTDEMIYQRYLRYTDTIGNLTGKMDTTIETSTNIGIASAIESNGVQGMNMNYVVILGSQEKSISANELSKYLGFKDFRMVEKNDTVYYVVGNYENLSDAVKRKYHLEKEGVETQGIAMTNGRDKIDNVPENTWPPVDGSLGADPEQVIFRVQIGAYSKKLSSNVFKDVPDLLAIPGEDGITRYYSGAFSDIYKASERKIAMLDKGFEGSFVVAYKGQQRKPLKDVGVEVVIKEDLNPKNDLEKSKIDKTKVKYKVQVGAFKNDVPTAILDKYLTIGGVTPIRDAGLTKYFAGTYSTKEEAEASLKRVVDAGLTDAFIVAEYNGKLISIEDIKSMLQE